ncbi:hypothetical protein [Streptomyces sp. NBRC 109706]|uniref:hypothetical protein n=1 Tax=Streptomyces sp. NBRC 109706 TaxID=1550035 RepID=UPI000AB1C9EA
MTVFHVRRLGATGIALGALLAPVAAQAATPSSLGHSPRDEDPAGITWSLVTVEHPTDEQQEAYDRITVAMDAAVMRYNELTDLEQTLTVHYEPGVPTADGNTNGTIRFGNLGLMNERTALHEISHTLGVGLGSGWEPLAGGGSWTGPGATALVESYDGASATLSTGGDHFWPYGLNYDDEFSETAVDRHVHIVAAMIQDGLNGEPAPGAAPDEPAGSDETLAEPGGGDDVREGADGATTHGGSSAAPTDDGTAGDADLASTGSPLPAVALSAGGAALLVVGGLLVLRRRGGSTRRRGPGVTP